ncbi:MAG: hypothetical protein ACRDLV_06830 [Solirubrobacteraceae bacterium]
MNTATAPVCPVWVLEPVALVDPAPPSEAVVESRVAVLAPPEPVPVAPFCALPEEPDDVPLAVARAGPPSALVPEPDAVEA